MKKIIFNLAVLLLVLGLSNSITGQNTPGTLTFTYTCPTHTSGNYETDGRYVIAVWIESCTPCGTTAGTSTFVKTKLRLWGGNTTDHLPTWVSKSGSSVVDATTGATMGRGTTGTFNSLANAFSPQTVTWNGTNTAGTVVADGSYRVAIQETWGHGTATVTRYIPFTKGTAVDSQTPTADTNFTNLSLTWSPTLATAIFSQSPDFVVYPNPSKGIFNLDFNNEVKNIKVVNVLGETVYEETMKDASAAINKKVDLSAFASGVYIFNVTNDYGTSSYKVLLDK
jgi:hypothetical protein